MISSAIAQTVGHTAGTRPHRTGDGRRGTHSGGTGGDTEGRGTDYGTPGTGTGTGRVSPGCSSMMEHTGVTMIGQEHEQGRVEGVSPTEFMGVKIRVKISRSRSRSRDIDYGRTVMTVEL